ncbi:MAG: ABC transporter ATP-binding protein [Acidimicrobiaceae bacterium]|nr:ABC transporter ATP-binding protein [Acidimicrobiaceae bacterium]
MTGLLEVENLAVELRTGKRYRPVLHDVSFGLGRGEVVALVGESGSGKSMTARAIMGLLPPDGRVSGAIRFNGEDVRTKTKGEMREFRARRAGMIFQDPRAAINPVHRVGDFLTEALVRERGMDQREAMKRAEALAEEVGIDDPRRRLRQYPHQLSGGMLQRVMIASVLLAEPELLLADEPTTALDMTTQAEVVAILDDLRRARGMAMVFITHDLELAAAFSDRIAVMYAGYIVEISTPAQLREQPLHPYTTGLLASRPELRERTRRVPQIPGRPRSAAEAPPGCPFNDRCPYVQPGCQQEVPEIRVIDGSLARCIRTDELRADRDRSVFSPDVRPSVD